ncbi:unnamed protein product [Eruca vesicaria subsp. sativa]|uniref:Zinc finger GRF-type domain-containing protein n=1 Tax=Eruca vesicaria subsp. sativa TaxID=29727 RepID=A0ABC8JE84_ERUVS|nr:unnamed protein product [Eruca vesicaria subsp. sativa]
MVVANCVLVGCQQRFSRLGQTVCLKEGGNKHCSYFEWLDGEEVNGWPKRALIKARDEILEKKKRISELTATVNFIRMESEQHKVEKPSCCKKDEKIMNLCSC